MICCASSWAATFYVDAAATGADNGSSWGNAHTNLQTAIAAAGSLDEVWVKQGLYFGPLTFGANDSVYGGFDGAELQRAQRDIVRNKTIIHGNGGRPVLLEKLATIDGFTITGGVGTPGSSGTASGVHVPRYKAGTIENCTFTNNTGGAAVFGSQTGPETLVVRGCYFEGHDYGAIHYWGRNNMGNLHYLTVDRCTFVSNSIPGDGGAINLIWSSSWQNIYNCSFYGNSANRGGAISVDSMWESPVGIWNCAFSDNVSTSGVGHAAFIPMNYSGGAAADIMNCIVWGNDWSQIAIPRSEGSMTFQIGSTCIQNGLSSISMTGTKGSLTFNDLGGNISDDPIFYNRSEGDLRLFRNSPCEDVATSNGPPEIVFDISGIERPMGEGYDMGAYEYLSPVPKGTTIMVYGFDK